jgi:uncharacterized RDD family membrane protein YckC
LPREVTVVTPENIPLSLELAGLGSRFGALLLDLLIQLGTMLALLIVTGLVAAFSESFWSSPTGRVFVPWLTALAILGTFLILFGYFVLFETIWNGQTPGKRAFGLRVVREGGYPINFFASATRNLIRIADFLPVAYAAGALSVFFHRQYKRLGDLAAGTLVVKERPTFMLAAGPVRAPSSAVAGQTPAPIGMLPPTVRHPSEVLSRAEIDLLRRFARRRWEMHPDDAERLAYRLAVPLIPRLNLTFVPNAPPRYADLISVLVAAADAREDEKI